MRMYFKILSCLFLTISIVGGCTQEKNKAEEPQKETEESQNVSRPKNFERVKAPLMLSNQQEQAGYIITHFWDKFDFRDTMYCHANDIMDHAITEFLNYFPYATEKKIYEGVKKLLDSAEVKPVMYEFFFKKAEYFLYNPYSPMRNDEFYIPFLEHVIASQKVQDVSKAQFKYQLTLAYRNRVGGKASDFTYMLNSGRTGNLYGISADYLLLMFYDPDCQECKETVGMIKKSTAISAAISDGRLKVLAVYTDENIDAWKKYLTEIPFTWINGYDKPLSIRNQEIYDLKTIPLLYLLDKDKKVIFKDGSIGNIHNYLERNQ